MNIDSLQKRAGEYAKEVFGDYDPEQQAEYDHFVNHLVTFSNSESPNAFLIKALEEIRDENPTPDEAANGQYKYSLNRTWHIATKALASYPSESPTIDSIRVSAAKDRHEKEYWKKRCEASEKLILIDQTSPNWNKLYNDWQSLKSQEPK